MNRLIGPLLALVLLILVGAGIWFSASDKIAKNQQTQIVGLIGSEKIPFFVDPEVIEALATHGISVDARKAGSRQIANHPDLPSVDFAFPAGTPAATKIKQSHPKAIVFTPFYTPMAIATWQPIIELLTKAKLVESREQHSVLNMQAYLTAFQKETRWLDLPNSDAYPSSKQIFIKTTDVRKSNSASMYLALMSYLINNQNVVTDDSGVKSQFPLIQDLFLKQGFVESSSQVPFDDYLVMGMGHTPLLFIYEAQYIDAANPDNGGLPPQAALLYPEPAIFSKHVFLGLTDAGKKLGQLLEIDETLKKLANRHGFRNDLRQHFSDHVKSLGIELAPQLVNVIEPPSYEITEKFITRIEAAY